jgi:hypothetical protein
VSSWQVKRVRVVDLVRADHHDRQTGGEESVDELAWCGCWRLAMVGARSTRSPRSRCRRRSATSALSPLVAGEALRRLPRVEHGVHALDTAGSGSSEAPRDHREGKPALLDGDDDADGIHVLRHRRRAEPRGLTSRRGARHAVVTMFSGGGALRDLSGGRGAVPRRRPRLRQEIDKSGPAGCCTVERLWRGTVEPDARRGAGR